jgi:MoxR-like ATPase
VTLDYRPLQHDLANIGYIADEALAMALCLMIGLGRPLLIEGAAGVGKTEIGKALAQVLKTRLIRLQCYEGLDANATIYEWNYQRQLLAIRAHERDAMPSDAIERHIFAEEYLLRRPLLEAISQPTSPVLLIDESTGPTRNSRRSCSKYSPISRSLSPSSARSLRARYRMWS